MSNLYIAAHDGTKLVWAEVTRFTYPKVGEFYEWTNVKEEKDLDSALKTTDSGANATAKFFSTLTKERALDFLATLKRREEG